MRIILTILVISLMPLAGWAQTRTITIEDAIQIALENNYQLKQAANILELRRIEERSAKADLYPSLSASLSRQLSIGRQFDETTGAFDDLNIHRFQTGVNSSVTVFNGFANINNLRSARFDTESQEEQLRRVRENIIFNTASSYLEYLLDIELLEIAEENLQTANRQLEQVSAQVEVGARPSVDLLNQEAAVADAELQVVNQENQLNMSRLQLIRQLQVDPVGDYEFITPEFDTDNIVPQEYDLYSLINAAQESRSDLKSEERSIQATLHQLRATRANLFPTISLSGSVGTAYSSVNPFSYSDQFFDQNISRAVGASISIPIFDNFNRRTDVRSQEINYRNALLSLENTRLQITQEVNQAYNDYMALIQELESSEKAAAAAERAYETELQRYEIGMTTLIELSQANTNYVQAQSNRVQALYNFIFQEKLLDYYIGRLSEDISF